jgi:predicted phosphodiesterase
MKKITLISDTHTKHTQLNGHLPGGDLLIHAGDFMNSGYSKSEAIEFFEWFDNIPNYETKIFIGGNHDRLMEYGDGPNGDSPEDNIRIYGSPWQPWFYDWAFNLPRNGKELQEKWDAIPTNTDILITHSPAWGTLDDVEGNRGVHLGCELLAKQINEVVKPKIHVCGHIHSGRGIEYKNGTLFINASVLNESYEYTQKPITIDFDFTTGEYEIISM